MLDDEQTSQLNRTLILEEAPKPAVEEHACLVIIYGDDIGRRVSLGLHPLVLGRSPDCQVEIDQQSVSRRHASVSLQESHYALEDLGSTNGTFVNDQPIESTGLRDGDQIQVGQTIFKFLVGNNIEAQYHEVIYRLMTVDALTDVHNRRYFEEVLEREVLRAQRHRRDCSLVLVDLDHFKEVNDTYGHLAGDAILRQASHLIKERLRRDDVVARIGGEEFALLLPEVPASDALEVAEELRRLIAEHEFHFDGTRIAVTVSIGVASWSAAWSSPQDLLEAADGKLYEAKNGGRNRVCA